MPSIHRGASKLVIAIDIGATSSAVAWQHLQRDAVTQAPINVAQWTGAHSDYDVKVPTCILYKGDKPVKFGQEAEDEEGVAGTCLIRYPKLVLHPKWLQDIASAPLPPLIPGGEPISTFEKPTIPAHLTIEKIYKDFMTYLIEHTRTSFIKSHLRGAAIFDELVQSAHWILGAPNAWSAVEKQFLVDTLAATRYCLDKKDIQVVSEAEASLLFLIHTCPQAVPLKQDALLTVCDAGGSTIDITMYRCIEPTGMRFEEVGAALCIQKGAYYTSKALEAYLFSIFDKNPKFSEDAKVYSRNAIANFDSGLKKKWNGTKTEAQVFKFSTEYEDTEASAGIRNGKLSIPADYINTAFDTCVQHVISGLRQRLVDSQGVKAEAILLVGGFGDSPYLQRVLRETFEERGPQIPLLCPSTVAPGVKAVSAGGVYIVSHRDSGVTARASLFSYGVCVNVPYDPSNPEHRGRFPKTMHDGERYVTGHFARIINKDETTTSDDFRSSVRFTYEAANEVALRIVSIGIFMYVGAGLPNFMHERDGSHAPNFYKLGTVSGRGLRIPIKTARRPDGTVYYTSDFRVGVSFGGLEIRARIEKADGTDFGQEIKFRASAIDAEKKEHPRRDHDFPPAMRRRVRCAA